MTSVLLLVALTQTLTIEIHARPVYDTIRIIAEATDSKFEVDGALRNEILVVRVKDAPLEETLAKIAEVVHGEWRLDKGVRHLSRPPATRKALEAKELKERTEAVRKSLEPLLKASGAKPFDSSAADDHVRRGVLRNQAMAEGRDMTEFRNLEDQLPMTRALRRLLALIDPLEMAKLGRGERAVYTDKPNLMQRPLPQGGLRVVESLVEESLLLEAAGARYRKSNPNQRVPTPGESGVTSAMGLRPLLVVQRRGPDSFDFSLRFADEVGRMLGVSMTIHNIAGAYAHAPKLLDEVAAERTPWVPGTVGSWHRGTLEDPPEVQEARANPETVDPLNWFSRTILEPWADARTDRLVACLPDRIALVWTPPAGSTLATVGVSIQTNPNLRVTETNGWLLVRPAQPVATTLERSDRKAVGEFLRTVVKEGRIRLSVESQLALGAPYSWDTFRPDQVAAGMGVPLRQTSPERAQGFVERPFLQMLHSLTDGQLDGMRNGGLRSDRLSAVQRAQAAAAFYSLEGIADPYGPDPAEVAPLGLEGSVLVELRTREDVVADGRPRGEVKSSTALAATRLADAHFVSFMKSAPEISDMEYRVGKRTSYDFTFVVGGNAPRFLHFDDSPELAKEWVGADELPSTFKEQMIERFEKLRSQPGRGKPPPN